jgi:plasmid stabilization system protein ParE
VKLVYTDVAVEDLKRLRQFIAVHDPSAAARIATDLIDRIALLPEFPRMGRPVELAPVPESVRDVIFGKYVVRYSVHASAIIVLRVWHGLEERR